MKRGFDPKIKKRLNLSKRKIAILIGVNRETVRKVSQEPLSP
jgi:DNA-binding XRE family transcriptional regulator